MKKYLMKLKNKNIRRCDLNCVSCRKYIFIGMYIIALSDNVKFQLYLRYDYYYLPASYLLTYLLLTYLLTFLRTYSMEQSRS